MKGESQLNSGSGNGWACSSKSTDRVEKRREPAKQKNSQEVEGKSTPYTGGRRLSPQRVESIISTASIKSLLFVLTGRWHIMGSGAEPSGRVPASPARNSSDDIQLAHAEAALQSVKTIAIEQDNGN